MVGLGTMGANLVLNMVDKGFTVAGFDKQVAAVQRLNDQQNPLLQAFSALPDFVQALQRPRTVFMLVPAGALVDEAIRDLEPYLQDGDALIDCGNSHFRDTERRMRELAEAQILFMGVGISGGESGARNGPSIMPGGDIGVHERIAPLLQKIAAQVDDVPCTAYLGRGGSGHFIKMVHNGIEYAMMQLIAETYQVLKDIGELDSPALQSIFVQWNEGRLQAYLISITAAVLGERDSLSHGWLVDKILDRAQQKGTGAWTSQEAMQLGMPVPAIDAAVTQRQLSAMKAERVEATQLVTPARSYDGLDKNELIHMAEEALYSALMLVFAQGLALIQRASSVYGFQLHLADVTSLWRGGCIIRARMLHAITEVYKQQPELPNLLLAQSFHQEVAKGLELVRMLLQLGIQRHMPLPVFSACLHYYDSYTSASLPANLIQAQRDYFGAHTYERIDREGHFHTVWTEKIN